MKNKTLSRRYAKAFFSFYLSQKEGLPVLEKALVQLNTLVQIRCELLLQAPNFFDQSDASIQFMEWSILFLKNKKIVDDAVVRFIKLLFLYKRWYLLDEIAALFLQALRDYKKCKVLTVQAAYPLTEKQKEYISSVLDPSYTYEIKEIINASLVAGVRVFWDDYSIDLSVLGRLEKIKQCII